MSLAYVSLGASIFVLVSFFAPSSSVCIAIHITVFFKLFGFCHRCHFFLSIFDLHFTSFLFTVFDLLLTRDLFVLFYRFRISWDLVICQSVKPLETIATHIAVYMNVLVELIVAFNS